MKKFILALALLAALLAACGSGTATPPAATPTGDVSAASPTPPPTAAPSSTPTPAPGKVLLIAANLDTGAAPAVKARLSELASAAGMTLVSQAGLTPADLTPDVRIVVLLSAPDNLGDLLTAAPKTQFLALGVSGLDPRPNLSVVAAKPEDAAFVAGFIAAIISPDWRAGGLLPDAPPSIQDAFLNGGRYFCGRCVPIHGPIVLFPVAAALPAGSGLDAWQNAVTQLQANILETVYVDPSVSSPDLIDLLAKQGLVLVGGQTPPAGLSDQWAATVSADLLTPLNTAWPDLLAGKGNQSIPAAIQVTDINPSLLSPGKQRLMQDVIAGLQSGTIGPLSVP